MTLANARELRRNATECERLLWQQLRAHRLHGHKFKRQQPLGNYIVDFVCFEARVIIEADGGHHADQAGYDSRRDEWLKGQGFTVLRFWNNEILGNMDGVLERILAVCEEKAPSPQPLPHPGGGDNKRQSKAIIPGTTEASDSPLPSWERGRGRGGAKP